MGRGKRLDFTVAQVRQAYEGANSAQAMAAALGCSVKSCYRLLKACGLPLFRVRPGHKKGQKTRGSPRHYPADRVAAARRRCKTIAQCAAALDTEPRLVRRLLDRHGLEQYPYATPKKAAKGRTRPGHPQCPWWITPSDEQPPFERLTEAEYLRRRMQEGIEKKKGELARAAISAHG